MIDLKSILKQNPSCLNSRAAFKSVLLDKYPSEKRMVNILTILFECGVASKIKAMKIISPNDMQSLLTQVENEYGLQAKYTQDAILVWAAAFDITASIFKETQSDTTPPNHTKTQPVKSAPPVYVEGDITDYAIEKKADGYYITHFIGFEEEAMTIPSMIDGKPIIGIGKNAFKGCVTIKRLSISEGIEIIENCAFQECKSLEKILLPNTLKRIGSKTNEYGEGAFANTKVSKIIIPPNVDFLGPYSFIFCSELQEVILSDKIKTICKSSFAYCSALTKVKFPSELKTIESEAFSNCKKLTVIHIPFGTQTIKNKAFQDTYLKAVYIPPTVTKIGDNNTDSIFKDETFGSSIWGCTVETIYCAAGSTAMEYARKNNTKCAKAQF